MEKLGKKKNKISAVEMMAIKRLQDRAYNEKFKVVGEDEKDNVINPLDFLGRKVLTPDNKGDLKASKVRFNGGEYSEFSPMLVDQHLRAVEENKDKFKKTETDESRVQKEKSEKMEKVFRSLIPEIFPNFKISKPAEIDDQMNASDILLFQQEGKQIKNMFSLDLFYQDNMGTELFWKRKFFKTMQRMLNMGFGQINYINSGDLFFKGENTPVLILPISGTRLDRIFSEYENGSEKIDSFLEIKPELMYCFSLQISLFERLIKNLPSPKKSKQLLEVVRKLKGSLGLETKVPRKFKDKTLEQFCIYLTKASRRQEGLSKNLAFYQDTVNLKKDENEIVRYDNMTKEDREKSEIKDPYMKKRVETKKKRKTFWSWFKRKTGL